MQNARYSCQILMKLVFLSTDFRNFSNIKFHENPSSGNVVVPYGQTDRHDDANSLFFPWYLVPIVQEVGWAPGPVWTGAENLAPPPGFDPRTVQSVASRYTD